MNGTMVRPTLTQRLPIMAVMCCFVVMAHLLGQTTQNNRILLKPQSRTLLAGNACTVNQLQFTFRTGNDDLRGKGNDLNLEIHLANGSVQFVKNVNQGANWPNNSVHTASIPLEHPTPPDQIKSIRLIHLAQGGFSPAVLPGRNGPIDPAVSAVSGIKTEDNWDMLDVQIAGLSQAVNVPIAASGFHRFTGSDPSFDVNAWPNIACPSPDQVRQLEFLFKTGNDDLRGGKDDVGITIYGDGLVQSKPNANQGQRWADGSTHEVTVYLDHPVTIQQIHKIMLETSFTGGSGGDNWNMDSVEVVAVVNGVNHPLATYGFHRFSSNWKGPDAKTLTIVTH
jgi:hypothetical protein